MPVTAHHAPGEVPLAWQGGRELGAEPDNCVSSKAVAGRASAETLARGAIAVTVPSQSTVARVTMSVGAGRRSPPEVGGLRSG